MTARLDIPNPNAPNFEQRVREALQVYLGRQGSPLDRGLTLRDLVDVGLLEIPDGYTLQPGTLVPIRLGPGVGGGPGTPGPAGPPGPPGPGAAPPDLTPPPAPTGLTATGAFSHVLVQCDTPSYTAGGGHLRSRLYGAIYSGTGPLPTFSNAVEIGQFEGPIYAHPSNLETTWHLWLRWETRANVLGPVAGGTNGVTATTSQDVNGLLAALEGQITSSQLFSALNARINQIDTPGSGLLDRATVLETRTTDVNSGNSALAGRASLLEAAVNNPTTGLLARAAILETRTTAAGSGNAALASRALALEASVNTPDAGNNPTFARLLTEESVRAALDGSVRSLYTVRTELTSGGQTVVGGFGLAGTAGGAAGPTIDFGVVANRFFVAAPASSGVTSTVTPFVVQTTTWSDNGVTRPAGVFINAASIGNLAAVYATIQTLVADQITAATITAGQITGGTMRVGSFLQSTNYTSGPGGAGFRINADGTAELQAAYIRGLLQASQINVPGTWINSNITVNASGQLVGIGTENIQVDNSYQTIGQNLFRNSDQTHMTEAVVGWNPNSSDIPNGPARAEDFAAPPFGWTTANYLLRAGSLCNSALRQGAPTAGTEGGVGDAAIGCDIHLLGFGGLGLGSVVNAMPVTPGRRYCFSMYVLAHRCNANLGIFWLDQAGQQVPSGSESGLLTGNSGSALANRLDTYTRLQVFGVAPAGASVAGVYLRKRNTWAGQSDSWVWWAAPVFEEVSANAQGPSPYMPGPPSAARQIGYTGDLDATRGAPSGTPVGGTTADIVAATVAAVNDSVSGLNSRLRSNAASILTGPVTIQTGGAIQAISGANSVTITPTGIVGIIGGAARFTLNASTGEAVFGGALNAATGSFVGSVSVNGRTWTSGSGFFAGIDSGVPRLVIGTADQYLSFDGATGKLEIKLAGAVANPGPFFASGSSVSPNNAIARVRINRNGQVVAGGGASNATITLTAQGNWYIPNETAIGDLYDVRYDLVSGSGVSASALGAWQQLNADRLVELVRSGGSLGFSDAVVQYSIRLRSTNAVVATGNIYLSVTVDA